MALHESVAEPQIVRGEESWPRRRAAWWALALVVLATGLNFLGVTVFGMLVERIKLDLTLTDEQLGWLIGPASILFYMLIGIPMARLVDRYPRRVVLALGLLFTSASTALGGLAQSFGQLFGTRMLVGAGSSTHAPGCYSLIADLFPPHRLPRAIAVFQLGYIIGTTLGVFAGGHLLDITSAWGTTQWLGLTFYSWQWALLIVGAPGLVVAVGLLFIVEPARRGVLHQGKSLPLREIIHEVRLRKAAYIPLFVGVVFCAIESLSLQSWRTPFMIRTYGWTETEIGNLMAPLLFVSSVAGLFIGTALTEWLGKRHKDAHVRAMGILFAFAALCAIAYPLMPTGELSLILLALSSMFGLAVAVPQNAAIQRITPNNMRGQVTAIYVFIFTLSGALGSLLIALITRYIVGDEHQLWKALVITGALLVPLAVYSAVRGLRPYRKEVERLESIVGDGDNNTEFNRTLR
ncbi:MFS transporter [Niveispirillum sp. BGYR6]|uniref:MFS transporter n=1 Tax=Niveispirillum sp. BGYR6 TaxID=2971249 RepID=UPI0022B98B9E|nr:MFS transporter [Niveispirillum sp. BGYR6]MDG5497512.1 MFS transporter [Niveispirillum sp. BGYR6]